MHQFGTFRCCRYHHRMAAGTEHTLIWLEQTAKTKHSQGSPHQHLGRIATSRAGKQPLEGRSCCDFPSWALQLCSPTARETLPKRGMASSGTEAAVCPRGHIRLSLLVRARAPWSQPSFGCSQESPGHGSGWAVPQEPLPALCCIPEPHFRSRALQVLFLEWYCDGI